MISVVKILSTNRKPIAALKTNLKGGIFALFIGFILLHGWCFSQSADSNFVKTSGNKLILTGKPYYAIGVNTYYLQNLAAVGDTDHLLEVLQSAQALGVNTIRTWGFFDSSDSTNPAVLQYAPGVFNEHALQALDYVIAKAKQYSFRLIIPLVNNWDDYGGMNQYVKWLASTRHSAAASSAAIPQQTVSGAGGRSFRVYITSTLTHDDFYRNDTVKQWYKNYLQTILQRRNTITNILYKDDPTILDWELANEPRSLNANGDLINQWLDDMSTFVKSVDGNHLVSSGEEGFDVTGLSYSGLSQYNQQSWLFNGSAGVSFSKNISLQHIDVASIHCYPSAWNLSSQSAVVWLKDHQQLADGVNKPLIFGEVGTQQLPSLLYEVVFNEAFHLNTAGVLLWQLIYPGRPNNDGYGFSCPTDEQLCPIISNYTYKFDQKRNGLVSNPSTMHLYPNYPNPFNLMTVIPYDLPSGNVVKIEIFDEIGQLIEILSNGHQTAGYHEALFDGTYLASGIYFARLSTPSNNLYRKIVLLK